VAKVPYTEMPEGSRFTLERETPAEPSRLRLDPGRKKQHQEVRKRIREKFDALLRQTVSRRNSATQQMVRNSPQLQLQSTAPVAPVSSIVSMFPSTLPWQGLPWCGREGRWNVDAGGSIARSAVL
jgi:hypothetical protein